MKLKKRKTIWLRSCEKGRRGSKMSHCFKNNRKRSYEADDISSFKSSALWLEIVGYAVMDSGCEEFENMFSRMGYKGQSRSAKFRSY